MTYNFPKKFKFGWSQSGFQHEMGLPGSEDKRSDWYSWTHNTENILSGIVSGDLPENGPGYWDNYKLFHKNAEKMGLRMARVSVEWSRIFPEPLPKDYKEKDEVYHVEVDENILKKIDKYANKKAVEHYRNIFTDLKKRNMYILLNLYHFSLPLWIHDPIRIRRGYFSGPTGWLNSRSVYEFARFSSYVAWKFDDLIDEYSTMNEPNVVWGLGYGLIKSGFPPGYLSFSLSKKAMYNIIQAHARAYDSIREFTKKPIGIIYASTPFQPLSDVDKDAANLAEQENMWNFFDAITKGIIVKDGESIIREDLKNKLDFIGVNYYTRTVIRKNGDTYSSVYGYGHMCERNSISLSGLPTSDMGWEFYPEGLYNILLKYWNRYHLKMYITENGIADDADYQRPYYLVSHIYQVYRAIKSGIDVEGYLHWSLTDNYEWSSGFSMRYGLLRVNYETKKIYWRPSAFIYKEIATNNSITEEIEFLNSTPPIKPLRH